MKSKKPARMNIQLSAMDVDAILCALPLISYYDTGSDIQNQINFDLMNSAMDKLSTKNPGFLPNEYRVIYTAVALAVNIETHLSGIEIAAEWKAELKRHFFTLNRIHALTKDMIYQR